MATFVSVVEGKSLSAAARAQRLSLAAVSRQLRALEVDLGASLIVRSTRRLHVTDAGVQWYEYCRRTPRELEDAREAIRGSKAVRGTLVVSASLTFGSEVIVPQLARLTEQHPGLSIDLRLEDQIVDLVGEGVDVAIRAGSPPPDSTAVLADPIAQVTRVLVAAPRLPDWLVAPSLAQNKLRRVLPDWSSLPITAWAIYRSELRGNARLKVFLEALPKHFD